MAGATGPLVRSARDDSSQYLPIHGAVAVQKTTGGECRGHRCSGAGSASRAERRFPSVTKSVFLKWNGNPFLLGIGELAAFSFPEQ
jgi:hypothetical protein